MMGININCKHQDFIEQILSGRKILETRKHKTLDPYIGKRIGLIKTGCGKATLCGFATISKRIDYKSSKAFMLDYEKHLVQKGSEYDSGKYGYELTDVERCTPKTIETKGIISRRI